MRNCTKIKVDMNSDKLNMRRVAVSNESLSHVVDGRVQHNSSWINHGSGVDDACMGVLGDDRGT